MEPTEMIALCYPGGLSARDSAVGGPHIVRVIHDVLEENRRSPTSLRFARDDTLMG